MRLEIDPERCRGHAMCVVAAPELIDISPVTERAVLTEGKDVPTVLEDAAYMAVTGCPEEAIRVIET